MLCVLRAITQIFILDSTVFTKLAMSINIKVCESMISIKRKGISLADFQIEQKEGKDLNKSLSRDKLRIPAKKSSEKVDEKIRRSSGSKHRKDIVKKKERSKRKLMKLEKRYKYLENICYEYISPKYNLNKSLIETNDTESTRPSVSTLLELTQQVLQLEHEVNAVLFSGQSNNYNSNSTTDDDCEMTDFLLKLNKVKKRLVDEFDLNLSRQVVTDDSRNLDNISEIHDSTTNSEFQKSCSSFSSGRNIGRATTTILASSRLDEHEQMIGMLTEEILMDLKKISSSTSSNSAIDHSSECKHNKTWSFAPVVADLPKVLPSYSRNSLLHRAKPPANLVCNNNYKRMDIDFTIHELSVIYETDSELSRSKI